MHFRVDGFEINCALLSKPRKGIWVALSTSVCDTSWNRLDAHAERVNPLYQNELDESNRLQVDAKQFNRWSLS